MSVIFEEDDYKKILFKLFSKANDKDCKITNDFLKDNVKLLKKTVGENDYGITEGSTAFHILAKKEFIYFLVSAYSSQTFFRNIYSDIETIITCLHENIGDKEFFNKLRELNIINKKDKNGKTVSDIVDEILSIETDAGVRKKYQKLKDVIEQIKGTSRGTLKGTSRGTESDNLFKIEIENDSIVDETIVKNKKIIRVKGNKTNSRPFKIFLLNKKKTLKPSPKKSISRRSLKRKIV